jgi:hypothetical protein
MYDVFGLWRLMRVVQTALALLVAFGLLAGLAGMATGRLQREAVAADARPAARARLAAGRAPRPQRPPAVRVPPN